MRYRGQSIWEILCQTIISKLFRYIFHMVNQLLVPYPSTFQDKERRSSFIVSNCLNQRSWLYFKIFPNRDPPYLL